MIGFFMGLVLGGFVGICVMALLQINAVEKMNNKQEVNNKNDKH